MRNQELCNLAPGGHIGLENYINVGSDLFFGHLSLSPQNQLACSSEQVETKLKENDLGVWTQDTCSVSPSLATGRLEELKSSARRVMNPTSQWLQIPSL